MNKKYKEYLEDNVIDEDNAVDIIDGQQEEIERLNNIIKEAIEYIKSIPDDEFVESEHFTELLFIFGKVGSDKE